VAPVAACVSGVGWVDCIVVKLSKPPRWAVLQRALIDRLNHAASVYLAKYTNPDGSLIFRTVYPPNPYHSRDGVDDFYESFYPLPLLYVLGGSDALLPQAKKHWEGVTAQLARIGMLTDEYDRGYDWFHQGEGQLFFYGLCLASPDDPTLRARARRFAGLYADGPNYDAKHNIIRAPHTGSDGPRSGFFSPGEAVFSWRASLEPYGLPLNGVPGIDSYEALRDPDAARRMAEAMDVHFGQGDVAVNLAATALVANAYLLEADVSLRDWILRYIEGWSARARANGGLLPDNVGPGGRVGELFGGRWYGGLYGWSWPHGLISVGTAGTVAGTVATTLTGVDSWLDPSRTILDRVIENGQICSLLEANGSLLETYAPQFASEGDVRMFLVPHRFGRGGWFDYQPLPTSLPSAIWAASLKDDDFRRICALRDCELIDWKEDIPFRSKEDNSHERPWFAFLEGSNARYPEQALSQALSLVERGVERVLADDSDLEAVHVHHWQIHNPLTLEALIQLTLGGPSPLYNGGLLLTAVRHFDPERRRPGLPADVAALVTRVHAGGVALQIVNLNERHHRSLIVQGGSLAQHRFTSVRVNADPPSNVDTAWLRFELPPSSTTEVELTWARYGASPTYEPPKYEAITGIDPPTNRTADQAARRHRANAAELP
jgi:hypothetical protein